ncbi:hypothetical protein GCM10010383_71370 [Streptomyces lomondensis]|uniref:Uncharacterized protein n=1 Tax=Streptomyces lomondensis TaxID=68229 RepID=A0ABQ2XSD8_9ACTN|nr:hypothetical protein GCM10010383_71370 [Streptomyces lomondensis]
MQLPTVMIRPPSGSRAAAAWEARKDRPYVDGEHPVHVRERQALQRPEHAHARVVHQDVEPAQRLGRRGHRTGRLGRVRRVRAQRHRPAPQRLHGPYDALGRLLAVHVADGHVRALPGQPQSRRRADATAPAGHESHLAVESSL